MEALEDVRLCSGWNRVPGVGHGEDHGIGRRLRGHAHQTGRAIIFSGVLEQVLQDDRGVAFLAGNVERGREIRLDLEIKGVRDRAEIVERRFDECGEIHGAEVEFEVTGVHAREEEQILDHAGEAIGLMDEGSELLAFLG